MKMMVNFKNLAVSAFLLVLIGCASVPPQVNEFKANPSIIEEGKSTVISWNVVGADNVAITDIGEKLQPSGYKELNLNASQAFTLTSFKGKATTVQTVYVEVNKKQIEKPKTFPVTEKRNSTKDNYIKGIVNGENVKEIDEPQLFINLIDMKGYPDKVKLFCTVKDQYGNQVANLAPPYNSQYIKNWKSLVEIIENKECKVSDFNVQEMREDVAPPFTTSFVMDFSGSMEKDYQFVNEALNKAVTYLRPNKDDYEVVQFDHRVIKSVDITSMPASIRNLIPFNQLMGATSFYTASNLAIQDIKGSNKEKVAILFTDGADNTSIYSAYDVVLKAREVGAKVFIIGFNRQFGGYFKNILEAIAEQSGGQAYFPASLAELDDIFEEIYQIMNVYYVVTYTPCKEPGNIKYAKLTFDYPYFNKQLTASKKYFVKPEPIEERKIINVAWFDNSKNDLQEQFQPLIEEIAKLLIENPDKKISIVGHTDTKGSDALNNALSLRRAKALAQKLIKLGVKKYQILKVIGKGKKEPIYPDDLNSDWMRQENRRVAIELI